MYERFRYVSEELLSDYDRFCAFVVSHFKSLCTQVAGHKVGKDSGAFPNASEACPKASEEVPQAFEVFFFGRGADGRDQQCCLSATIAPSAHMPSIGPTASAVGHEVYLGDLTQQPGGTGRWPWRACTVPAMVGTRQNQKRCG